MKEGVVVVTGAAGGIGTAVVELLQDRGLTVLGVDRVAESSADEHMVLDASHPDIGDRVAEVVAGRPLRGLVNNAAESTAASTDQLTVADWDRILAANLRAPFLLAQRLVDDLAAGGGAVVNVSSVHAFETSVGAVPYAASKGGLNALTRALAVDWAARGIPVRVNAVAPAAVDTPMLRDGLARTHQSIEQLGRRHPVGRVGQAREVASVIAFLLSEEASYLTGVVVPVDGGALAQLSTEGT